MGGGGGVRRGSGKGGEKDSIAVAGEEKGGERRRERSGEGAQSCCEQDRLHTHNTLRLLLDREERWIWRGWGGGGIAVGIEKGGRREGGRGEERVWGEGG